MKKFTILMIAALFAVMFTAPAFAEERLSLSGSYFARGWMVDHDYDVIIDDDYVMDSDFDEKEEYFTQRMRVQARIQVADDVSATIRADMAEGVWGHTFSQGSVARPGAQKDGNFRQAIDFDRTYVTINKEMWSLQVGQQFFALGHMNELMDSQITGANFGLKFDPVSLNFIYAKISENGTVGGYFIDDSDFDSEDVDIYAANVGFAVGGFDSNIFFATRSDDTDEIEPWGLGASTAGALGIVNLVAEINFFGGDYGEDVDAKGLQFYLKGDSNINDMLNIGAEFLYAKGYQPDDDDEWQVTGLTNWDTFTPFSAGTPLEAWITAFPMGGPFDPLGVHGGVVGATVFASAMPMEKLSVGGKIGYFVPEEDKWVDYDVTAFNAWIAYEIATNTKLSLTYLYSSYDIDESEVDDPELTRQTCVLQLAVSF